MCISIFNELNANASKRVIEFCEMSTNSETKISSCGQELYDNDFPPPQIGLWQQHKLDKLFPSVHVEALAYGQV